MIVGIWRDQPGKYFCISTRSQGGVWKDHFFARNELRDIGDFIDDQQRRGDVYFAPNGFNARERGKHNALRGLWLYADLDEVKPLKLGLEPTLAIKTSPGRYQALWRCDDVVSSELAKSLVYHVGADKDSWAANKVLRVPGTINYKPEYDRPRVAVIWDGGPTYRVSQLERRLPRIEERKSDTGVGDIDFDAVPHLNGARLSLKYNVPISAPPMTKDDGSPDRSVTIMWLAGIARNNGATDEEIAAILLRCRRTFMDKYPRGLDDPRARKEIERICSKLKRRK